ncbi:hypothetical protein T08_3804 [Trichinella sp. T8]|nr:hypothetical protein T08_3804 [Trichinella sp. T8]
MYNHRAKRYPKLPSHRQDLQIPVPFRTTKAGDNFLSWQSASRHILVFATGYNIRLLAAMRTWGMDGTFKVVPQWYQQLFTIHAFVAGKLVPAVYCLCTGKDIKTYGYIFQALMDKAAALEVDLNPETIICDFETALIPAIRGYFPNTRVQGCYFHFCQAVHRKVGELGLKTRYRTEEPTKRKIRMLLATAFLPVPHVNTGVSLLEAGTTGTLAALFQYFRQEWMTDERLPLWNVYNVNIRTNNHLEGWHNRLNRKAGKSHNGLYELLQLLIAEQGVMDTLIQQVLSGNATVGDLRRVNKVYAQKQRQVARYTGEYTNVLLLLLLGTVKKHVDVAEPNIMRQYNQYMGGRSYNLLHQGKVYQVKHTNIEDKQWIRRQIEKGCRGSIHMNLDVDGIFSSVPHADDCTPDNDILYKTENKIALKRRAAE